MRKNAEAAVIVLLLALLADWAYGHTCTHSFVPGVAKPPPVVGRLVVGDEHRRAMTAQGGSITWRRIRVTLNYSFTSPALDVFANGQAKACSRAGEELMIGGGNPAARCLGPNGDPLFTGNCILSCRPQDVLTTAKLVELQQRLATVEATIEGMLEVPLANNGRLTVFSDRNDENTCSGLDVPEHELDTDFVVFVTARPLHHLGNTLANAKPCALEPAFNRPSMAHVNIAPATLGDNNDFDTVLLHELTHGLGFTPGLFSRFRHPSDPGKTYFEFDPDAFPTGPVAGDGITGTGDDAVVNISLLGPGKRLLLVTPNVVAFAREYFGCEELVGVELENGGDSSAATASHWEKRKLYFEYMTATQNTVRGILSGFTLAFLTDMGFYRGVMNAAMPMEWGKGQGCTWVHNCSAWPEVSDNYLCTSPPPVRATVCGFNRKFIGRCNTFSFTEPLPVPYRHFPDPHWGGSDELADHCPLAVPLSQVDCRNDSFVTADEQHQFGAMSGDSARCVLATAVNQQYQLEEGTPLLPTCRQIVCNNDGLPLIRIGHVLYPCRDDDDTIELLFPFRHRRFAPSQRPPNSTNFFSYTSYTHFGLVSCGRGLRQICANAFGTDDDVLRSPAVSLPVMSSVYPTEATVVGRIEITITGANLGECTHIAFGGILVEIVGRISESVVTSVVPPVPEESHFGGDGPGGAGPAALQLWCNVSGVCPRGCGVSHLVGHFTYLPRPEEAFELSGAFSDFITSTAGKAAGGGLAALLVIALLFVIKGAILDDGSSKRRKEEEALKRLERPQGGTQQTHALSVPLHSRYDRELL